MPAFDVNQINFIDSIDSIVRHLNQIKEFLTENCFFFFEKIKMIVMNPTQS